MANLKFRHKVKNYWKEFCNSTSIHGVRYFAEDRTITERICWFLAFMSSVAACVFSICQVYLKWERNAIIISPANIRTSVLHIPFPAITICPENKFVKSKVEDSYDFDLLNVTTVLIGLYQIPWGSKVNKKYSANQIYDVIYEAKPSFNFWAYQIAYLHYWNIDVLKPITTIITNEGICHSYNLINKDKILKEDVSLPYPENKPENCENSWTIEHGFTQSSCFSSPRQGYFKAHPVMMRRESGLNLLIVNSETDNQRGYKIKIDSPLNIPQLFDNNILKLDPNRMITVNVNPVVVTTSDSLKKYFRNYTVFNCKFECSANYTLHYCGCVAFYMPRINNVTTICQSLPEVECMEHALDLWDLDDWMELRKSEKQIDTTILQERQKMEQYLNEFRTNYSEHFSPMDSDILNECHCGPACDDLSYSTDVLFEEEFKWPENMASIIPSNFTGNMSALNIKFASNTFVKSERTELYGPIDFVSNFGGLLGLFLGFSIISFFEIIYFLTIRLLTNRHLHGHWSGAQE